MDLSPEEVDQYEQILHCETVDTFNMIIGKQEVPKELQTVRVCAVRMNIDVL